MAEPCGRAPRDNLGLGVGRTFQITATFGSYDRARELCRWPCSRTTRRRITFAAFSAPSRRHGDALLARSGCRSKPPSPAPSWPTRPEARGAGHCVVPGEPVRASLLDDEPTAGMAPEERGALMALAASLREPEAIAGSSPHARHATWVSAHARSRHVLASRQLIAERAAEILGDSRVAGGVPWRCLSSRTRCRVRRARVLLGASLTLGAGEVVLLAGRNGGRKIHYGSGHHGPDRAHGRNPRQRRARRPVEPFGSPGGGSATSRGPGAYSPELTVRENLGWAAARAARACPPGRGSGCSRSSPSLAANA